MTLTPLIPLILLAALSALPVHADEDHATDTAADHAQDDEHGHDDDHAHDEEHVHEEVASDDDHLSTMGDVHLLHGWSRATSADSALVFVEIENAGSTPVTLTGGRAVLAQSATLVGFTLEDGTPTYSELPALPVAPGTEMVLAPQGVALRLDGLSRDLVEGDSFDVTLTFAKAEVTLAVEVEAADATQHSHAGHAH
jgi:hypothetical protein